MTNENKITEPLWREAEFKRLYTERLERMLSILSVSAATSSDAVGEAFLLVRESERYAATYALKKVLKNQGIEYTDTHKKWLDDNYP